MRYRRLAGVAAFFSLVVTVPAVAADDPPGKPEGSETRAERRSVAPAWEGFYFGGHVGATAGTASFSSPYGPDLFGGSVSTPGFLAGLQVGYNWLPRPQLLLGLEASGSYLTSQGNNTCVQPNTEQIGSDCRAYPNAIATFTGRLGYLTEPNGRTLVFGKAGAAWMHSNLSVNPNNAGFDGFHLTAETGNPVSQSVGVWGWTVGAGMEYAFASKWSLNLEYDYLRFSGINIAVPPTTNVTPGSEVSSVPGGVSSVTQDLHIARVGLNYHWGGPSKASNDSSEDADAARRNWVPGWEFEVGARYWYSSGNFQTANGGTNSLVSRLPYNGMTGHSGEAFGRLDSPYNVFFKGFVGGGGITSGTMYDEDWGLSKELSGPQPAGYQITQSGIDGSFNYLTADVGYNVLRGPDHKVGLFVGYNRYQTLMNTQGIFELAGPDPGATTPSGVNAITEIDTWNSLRVGLSTQVQLWDRFKIDTDLAYLPYVNVDGLDMHRLRNLNFPVNGTGNGFQGELILSYFVTDAFSIGVGGRYWSMWTTNAYSPDGTSYYTLNTDRYGVFLQGSYRFKTP